MMKANMGCLKKSMVPPYKKANQVCYGYVSLLAAALTIAAAQAAGAPVAFTATGINPSDPAHTVTASANFDIVSGNLVVVLTKTGTAGVRAPSDVLSALFFNISGINNLTGPAVTERLQHMIAPAGDDLGTCNDGYGPNLEPVSRVHALIQNPATFTLGSFAGHALAQINHISFQYGMTLTESHFFGYAADPEIYEIMLGGLRLMGFVAHHRTTGDLKWTSA